MANDLFKTAKMVQATGDLLVESANAMMTRRRAAFAANEIDAIESLHIGNKESTLRLQADRLFTLSNTFVLQAVKASQDKLDEAIKEANKEIARIDGIKHSLEIFSSLLLLAGALIAGQPVAIIAAIAGVKGGIETAPP